MRKWSRAAGAAGLIAGMVIAAVTVAAAALAGTPGSSPGNGTFVGGVVFAGPEPLVLWNLPGAGKVGTCIDADVNGPLTGPYRLLDTVPDPVYAELNHLYATSATSDVRLAELSALNSAKYDRVDPSAQWGYVTRGQGGLSAADANAMLAKARSLAGPYTVSVNWPAEATAVNVPYQASITVRSASGAAVPGAVVRLSASSANLAATSATTNASGVATAGFTIPAGTSSTFSITAAVSQWTSVDRYQSAGEQAMLVTGAPSSATGTHTAAVNRTRDVTLIKVDAADPAKRPVAGYVFTVTAQDGSVVTKSITSDTAPVSLGELKLGATYTVTELTAPPGGHLYVPAHASISFTVPAGTATWSVVFADPRLPTPSLQTQVSSEHVMTGQQLSDAVTVSGDDGEDGTITARLYGPVPAPASQQCSDVSLSEYRAAPSQLFTASVHGAQGGGNGTLVVHGPVVQAAGCYGWAETLTLQPSGATADSTPTTPHESTLASTPEVRTTVSAQVAMPGTTLRDTAEVTGLTSSADLSAVLYGPLPPAPGTGAGSGCDYGAERWEVAIAADAETLVAGRSHMVIDGGGRYVIDPVNVTAPGCYTYAETLTPTAAGVAPVATRPGDVAESTTVIAPTVGTAASPAQPVLGGQVHDVIDVQGIAGVPTTITGQLLGPVPPANGSCVGLDWTGARVAGVIPALHVSADGRYRTGPIGVKASGCYTFAEVLTTPTLPRPVLGTPAGQVPETVLVPDRPLAVTGAPVGKVMTAGIVALVLGMIALALGSSRRRWQS